MNCLKNSLTISFPLSFILLVVILFTPLNNSFSPKEKQKRFVASQSSTATSSTTTSPQKKQSIISDLKHGTSSIMIPCKSGQNYVNKKSSKSPYIRLYGEKCSRKSKKLLSANITNRTNGITSEVFLLKKGSFTSDLIKLSDGQNEIQIIKKFSNGDSNIFSLFINNEDN